MNLTPAERLQLQMLKLHDPGKTIDEHLNQQLSQDLISGSEFYREWRSMVYDMIERIFSVARARNIDLPSACFSIQQSPDKMIALRFHAVDGLAYEVMRNVYFYRQQPPHDTGRNYMIWSHSKHAYEIAISATCTDGMITCVLGSGRYCMVETIVETWIELIYGGPHRFNGSVTLNLIEEKNCTCPPRK